MNLARLLPICRSHTPGIFTLAARVVVIVSALLLVAPLFASSAPPDDGGGGGGAVCTTNPVVVNVQNSGAGSLRQAVIDACPGSTITFAVTGTIPLSTGRIVIDGNLTIQGPGANLLTVRNSSTSYDRVFQVNSGVTATLAGLTVSGGTFSIYIDNQNGAGINNQGNLTVRDATITGNTLGTISSASSKGGGIYNAGTGTLKVTNSTISNNSAVGSGGGIFNDSGTVTVTKSIITGNQARFYSGGGGGGISNYGGVVTVTDSTVSNNRSGQTGPSGGGLKNDNGGTITLTNSTVSSNLAKPFSVGGGGGGGGISIESVQRAEEQTVTDSTISPKRSIKDKPRRGGLNKNGDTITLNSLTVTCPAADSSGLYSHGGGIANTCGTVTLINSTVMSNAASDAPYLGVSGGLGWNIYNGSGATVSSRNSIIAGSRPDYFGTLTSQGYNLLGMNIDTTMEGDTTGNIVGTGPAPINPLLGGLGNNGGPTPTHAVLAGSPVINAGNTATSPAVDQRGYARNGTADIGAYEFAGTVAPAANNQSVTTNEDTAKSITLTADPNGGALTFNVVANPTHGTLSGTAPDLTYTPDANYNGSDSFTFKANDGTADSNTATVSITIAAINDAPSANSQSVTTSEDTAKSITLSASDPDGDTPTYSVVGNPTHGTLSGSAPDLTYTPNTNYNGSDSFTYNATDGTVDSNTATVSITVTAVNDAPVADGQSVTTDEDTAKAVTLSGSDVDGDALTYSVVASPTHGSLSGSAPNLTYTPNANYNGSDSFTFKGNDGTVDSNTATVSITVTAVNDAPAANGQSVTTDEDTAKTITLTGSDVDGDGLTYSVVAGPTHGTLSGSAPNLTYTPNANYNGPDSFTFKANDGTVDSNTATVSITVTAVDPDLIVSKLVAVNNQAKQGEKVTLTATIKNQGRESASVSKTQFLLDGKTQIGLVDASTIAPGATTTVSVSWYTASVKKGQHTIKATADKTGLVPESNENNNGKTITVSIQGNQT